MLKRAIFLTVIALGAGSLARSATPPAAGLPRLTAQELSQGYRDGYVMAKPRKDHLATVDAAETAEGMTIQRKFPRFGGLRLLKIRAGETPTAAVARLKATGRYEFVEPDAVRHASDVPPNDPDFDQQWALDNTGSNGPGTGIAGADIHALAAWSIRTSAYINPTTPIIVAVLDTGVRLTHTDIVANLWINPQENLDGYAGDKYGINESGNGNGTGDPEDDEGHGTHVSGILGAVGNNDDDISGVAWQVQIMPLKFLDSSGNGTVSNEITCIDFAISHGAKLINASFGSAVYSQSEYTAIQTAGNGGIAFIAAAGNVPEDNDLTLSYPASYLLDNVVGVGCSDNRDDLAYFTSYGSGIVDLFAPGDEILSLYNTSDTATATLSGTSMSTPMVTGSLALLAAQFPTDTCRQLINRILRTVDQNLNFTYRAQTGGRLDLASALALAPTANGPFNDAFANRAHLAGSTVAVRSNNTGATRESGEPAIQGNSGGASLWWDWTSPASGMVTVSTSIVTNGTTLASGYPTLVGVYTGTSLNALTDMGSGTGSATFSAQAGTTYEITVDGQNGATGLTLLGISYNNDAFEQPVTLTGVSTAITASNLNASREGSEPHIQGNAGGHSVWYKWTPPATGQYQVSVFSPDFDPLLGVYTGSSVSALTLVTSAKGGSISSSQTTAGSTCTCTFNAVMGTPYSIAVDGQSADDLYTGLNAGQFTLSIDDSAWQGAAGDGITCAPAIGSDGTVYVGSDDDYFYAFNSNYANNTKWKYKTFGELDTSAASISSDGSTVYAVSEDGHVYALATATGSLDWSYTLTSIPACAPTVGADGTIYVKDIGNSLYALAPAGTEKWVASVPGESYAAPVIAADGTIYIGSDNGNLYAFSPAAGALKWTFTAQGPIFTAAAVDSAGNVYFGTLSGMFYAVNPLGQQIWSYAAGNSISSSPALGSNGYVYFGCYDHNLYALAASNGAVEWKYTLGGEVRASSPAIDASGVVYIGCYDNNVYAINPNGTLDRIFATGDLVRSSPAIGGGYLSFGSDDHKLYTFNTGAAAGASAWPMYLQNAGRTGLAPAVGPTILTQPQGATLNTGVAVTLSVVAYGSTPLNYQWSKGGTTLSGATSSSYTLSSPQTSDSGTYTVTVSNTVSSVTSAPATLNFIPPGTLTFSQQPGPASVTATSGRTVVFNATATGSPAPSYQWTLNGSTSIPGASDTTDPVLMIAGATAADAGTYVCTIANIHGSLPSASATLSVTSSGTPAYLTNLSARADDVGGSDILIGGLTLSGSGAEPLLLRGIGPGITQVDPTLTALLPNPVLQLFDNHSTPIVSDAGWGNAFTAGSSTVSVNPQQVTESFMQNLGAFYLPPNSPDSAMEVTAPLEGGASARPYTFEVTDANGATGIGLVEVYDAGAAASSRLINLSARADVGAGGNILIGGLTIGGSTAETVLLRADGPGLAASTPSLAGSTLAQPSMSVYSGSTVIYSNTVWGNDPVVESTFAGVGAFPLSPDSTDCAMLITLPAGGYTVQVSGVGGTTGIALVEIYEVL